MSEIDDLTDRIAGRASNSRIIQAITAEPWAITTAAMERILTIAMREDLDPQAIDTNRPPKDPMSRMRYGYVRSDGIGVLEIHGPVFRYANLFTEVSGATATEIAARDLRQLLDDPKVKQLVVDFDSPGGQVNGTEELAEMIYAARGTKPILAYASGQAASAAYWMASAADRVISNRTSLVGSIGAVVGIHRNTNTSAVEFVSAQSPKKHIDPTTDAGRAEYQKLVDSIGQVFIETVARNRNVDTKTVAEGYGQGGVMVGGDALAAGLVDELGSFESLVANLVGQTPETDTTTEAVTMNNSEVQTDPVLAEWNASAQLRHEFDNDLEVYRAYNDAVETGRVKVLRGPRRQLTRPAEPDDPAFEAKVLAAWKADADVRAEFDDDVTAFVEFCRHEHLARHAN